MDAQDTYVVGCSYSGKIKAGDKFVNSETGAVYTISGAIMINEKTSPDDFVLSVDTGKINLRVFYPLQYFGRVLKGLTLIIL